MVFCCCCYADDSSLFYAAAGPTGVTGIFLLLFVFVNEQNRKLVHKFYILYIFLDFSFKIVGAFLCSKNRFVSLQQYNLLYHRYTSFKRSGLYLSTDIIFTSLNFSLVKIYGF